MNADDERKTIANPHRVLVTGASRGIGRAVAIALAARGDDVVCAGRDVGALKEVARHHKHRMTAVVGDLALEGPRDALVSSAVSELGGLDVLVQCAGIVHYEATGTISPDALAAQVAVNLTAPMMIAQAAAPHLVRTRGVIVNVASTLAHRSAPGTAVYGATKAAMVAWSRTFALELAPHVRVNSISPGVVETDMIAARPPAELEALRGQHALRRFGRAEEIAAAVLFVIDAGWMTGTDLVLDGGLSLG